MVDEKFLHLVILNHQGMYPISIREIACRIYSLVNSLRKTEFLVLVSKSSISRWVKSLHPSPYPRRNTITKTQVVSQVIRDAIACNPLTPVCKIQESILKSLGVSVSKPLIYSILKSHGYTRKKARFCGRPSNQQVKSTEFVEKRDLYMSEGRHIVSIDETSFGRHSHNHVMGYAPKGVPLYISKKQPRTTTTSVAACVSKDGLVGSKTVHNGSFNTQTFLDFLESLDLPPGTVILMDNVKFHHSKAVTAFAQRKRLTILYIPPYSPWFNPIEYCFSVIKRAFHMVQNIHDAFGALRPEHCKAFFEKSLSSTDGPLISYLQAL